MKKILRSLRYVLIIIVTVSNIFAGHEVKEVKNQKVMHANQDVARQTKESEMSDETVRTGKGESKDTAHVTDAKVFFETEDTDLE